jgi:FeS assembly SUF system protein
MTPEEKEELREEVIAALQDVYDPEIPVDIYKLGLIYNIDISDTADVAIRMTLTTPNCPAAQSLPEQVKKKTEELDGVNSAEVEVVFDPPWTTAQMDDAAKLTLNIL